MKAIIESIQEKLADNEKIHYVDENWGQLDYYSPNFPVKWPCVLIDVVAANYSNVGRDNSKTPANRQMGSITVELRVANVKLTNTSAKAPATQQAQARSIFQLIEEVHVALHGWNPDDMCSKLIRVSQNRVKRDDGVQEYAIRYTAELNNC